MIIAAYAKLWLDPFEKSSGSQIWESCLLQDYPLWISLVVLMAVTAMSCLRVSMSQLRGESCNCLGQVIGGWHRKVQSGGFT